MWWLGSVGGWLYRQGMDLTPWQDELLKKLLDRRYDRVVLEIPHRSGRQALYEAVEAAESAVPD